MTAGYGENGTIRTAVNFREVHHSGVKIHRVAQCRSLEVKVAYRNCLTCDATEDFHDVAFGIDEGEALLGARYIGFVNFLDDGAGGADALNRCVEFTRRQVEGDAREALDVFPFGHVAGVYRPMLEETKMMLGADLHEDAAGDAWCAFDDGAQT